MSSEIVRKCYNVLEHNLPPLAPLLGTLYQEGVIDSDLKIEIGETASPRKQTWILLDRALSMCSVVKLEIVCDILERSERNSGLSTHGKAAHALREQIELSKRSPSPRPRESETWPGGLNRDKSHKVDDNSFAYDRSYDNGSNGSIVQRAYFNNNSMQGCQINFFGSANNCSITNVSGDRRYSPQLARKQELLFPRNTPPPSYRSVSSPQQETSPSPTPTPTQSWDKEDIYESMPSVNDIQIHIISLVDGREMEFCQILGVDPVEVDGHGGGLADSIKRERPNLTWKELLHVLFSMGLDREVDTLRNKIRLRQI